MTYQELIKISKEKYKIDDKTIDYLIKHYFKLQEIDKSNNSKIDKEKVKDFKDKAELIKKGIPIQYVIGNVDFYGYEFNIKEGVLIPRFETEELIFYTKQYILNYFNDNISLIDVGTGSGVIGLSLKKEIPNLKATLIDISFDAIELSKQNAKKLGVEVDIYKSDMLKEVIKKNKKYDVLISNPPYLKEDEEIMDIVKKYEPETALYGGPDGLKYYDLILKDAKKILNDKALIAFEIGADQKEDLIALSQKYFKGTKYEVKKDLQGRDRMFFIFYNIFD